MLNSSNEKTNNLIYVKKNLKQNKYIQATATKNYN